MSEECQPIYEITHPTFPPKQRLDNRFHGRFPDVWTEGNSWSKEDTSVIFVIVITKHTNRELTLSECQNGNNQCNPIRVWNKRGVGKKNKRNTEPAAETGEFSLSHYLGGEQVSGRGCGLTQECWTGKMMWRWPKGYSPPEAAGISPEQLADSGPKF